MAVVSDPFVNGVSFLSAALVVLGWWILLGLTGHIALFFMAAGICGLGWSYWVKIERKVQKDGLLSILPASVASVAAERSILEILRPGPSSSEVPTSNTSNILAPIVEFGGLAAFSALVSAADDESFSTFFSRLPRSMKIILTRKGGIYYVLPRTVQSFLAPNGIDRVNRPAILPAQPRPRNLQKSSQVSTFEAKHAVDAANGKIKPKLADVPAEEVGEARSDAPTSPPVNGDMKGNVPVLQPRCTTQERKQNKSLPSVKEEKRVVQKVVLTRKDVEKTKNAAGGLVRDAAYNVYRPAEKAVVNLFSNAVKKILNSIARSAAATNSSQIVMAGGTSLLVLLLQLLSVKRARGRTLRILELLVYFVSLLVLGGTASAGFIKFAASMWLRGRGRHYIPTTRQRGTHSQSPIASSFEWASSNKLTTIGMSASVISFMAWARRSMR
mmetsp:Transcript_31441/g.55341  ORF Transcript_31441/g.55341 Transcript_31441/m.55341 type:complete len:442 (+) Transcript_31441:45-1370(+)